MKGTTSKNRRKYLSKNVIFLLLCHTSKNYKGILVSQYGKEKQIESPPQELKIGSKIVYKDHYLYILSMIKSSNSL